MVQYATAKIGAILVNINPSYRTHELEFVLKQAGISAVFLAESFKTSDYVAMLEEVRASCPGVRDSFVFGQDSWDALLARADEVTPEQVAQVQATLDPHDAINIQYTSGTTGFPKGATLSATATSSTTASSSASCAATPRPTGSASRCPSTTASAWSWATSPAPPTAPRW